MFVSRIGEGLTSLAQVPELVDGRGDAGVAARLVSLNLHGNVLPRTVGLSHLSRLAVLNLSSNCVSSLEGLGGLTSLTSLNIASNRLSSLRGLAGLSGLVQLNAAYNAITCISGVAEIAPGGGGSALASLNLAHNALASLQALAPLAGCLALRTLRVGGNPCTLSPAAYEALRQALPQVSNLDDSTAVSLSVGWELAAAQLQEYEQQQQQQQQQRLPPLPQMMQALQHQTSTQTHKGQVQAAVRGSRNRRRGHAAKRKTQPAAARMARRASSSDGRSTSTGLSTPDEGYGSDGSSSSSTAADGHAARDVGDEARLHGRRRRAGARHPGLQPARSVRLGSASGRIAVPPLRGHRQAGAGAGADAASQTAEQHNASVVLQLQEEAAALREQLARLADELDASRHIEAEARARACEAMRAAEGEAQRRVDEAYAEASHAGASVSASAPASASQQRS